MSFVRLTGACVALGLVVQERKLEAWQKVGKLLRKGEVVRGLEAPQDMYLGDLGTISTAYSVPWRPAPAKPAPSAIGEALRASDNDLRTWKMRVRRGMKALEPGDYMFRENHSSEPPFRRIKMTADDGMPKGDDDA